MSAVWHEPDVTERQNLFRDLVGDAETHEHVLILFGMLRNSLTTLAHETDTRRIRAGVDRALSVIAFLRDSLAQKPEDPFHGAFKRFYNHMHRQIIDALRDERNADFVAIAASIGTLTSNENASAFVGHCIEQSELRAHRLRFILERLFAAQKGPLLQVRDSVKDAERFSPLRMA